MTPKQNRFFWSILLIVAIFVATYQMYVIYESANKIQTNNLQQEQINLDSIKSYTTHITDSLTTINVEYKAKIESKNEVIRTLKGLVNDNNKKYQLITDSALVVELEKERVKGIK
jgi:TRAP-type mannitol/chloroaromatic compound transport system substrate-binding protein